MMKFSKFVILMIIGLLLFSFLPVSIAAEQGSYKTKDEVVYTTLKPNGSQKEMYVVNSFQIKEKGDLEDYGDYKSVKNLTDLSELSLAKNKVSFTASTDTFFYQGNLEEKPLPWNFDISYQLDGKVIPPDQLLGEDGHLKIEIATSKNENAGDIFYENYLLQIALTLDTSKYENIIAEEATVANAGKNKQISFTLMPEQEQTFVLEADVVDLELNGIEISAVPSSMSIDSPNVDEMTEDFQSLSDATGEINDGVGQLQQGISELNDGVASLENGSNQYQNGINELDNGSEELINGSSAINEALSKMKESLNQEFGAGDFTELINGLKELADGLESTEKGLSSLQENYDNAYQALDQAITAIPDYEISNDEINQLKQSTDDEKVVDKLVETYKQARKTKATYKQVKEAFSVVSPTLKEVNGSLTKMVTSLRTMSKEITNATDPANIEQSVTKLQEGVSQLASKYQEFHNGLKEYTNGVHKLSNTYTDLDDGISELGEGTEELENGAKELHNGTTELADSTSEIPEQMQKEVDEMINEYDKSDFKAISFVSEKNEKVGTVQFVIKTEDIKKSDDKEEEKEEEQKEKSFWDKLWDLFR